MSEPLPETCPECGASGPAFHQVYSGGQFVFVKGEPTTFGQQAERNAKRVGKEQMQAMVEQSREANHKGRLALKLPKGSQKTTDRYRAERPWWRVNSDRPLDVSKIKDKKRFIEEGK